MPKVNSGKIFQTKAKVIKNIEVAPDYYKMVLGVSGIAKQAQPGQFVNIRVSDKYEPFLRRPFSIHNVEGKHIVILYKVVGRGTEILSTKKKGQLIDCLGPLGNSFSLDTIGKDLNIYLVAGGMGVAPLVFFAKRMQAFDKVALVGARTKSHIVCKKELADLGCDVKIATEDGSAGFRGLVTQLLKKYINANKSRRYSTIFACGPKAMLEEISGISKRYKIPTQVSLEEHMACGIGGCFGCAVQTRYGYKRVCKEGPVFNVRDIKFKEEV